MTSDPAVLSVLLILLPVSVLLTPSIPSLPLSSRFLAYCDPFPSVLASLS